jgi:hypothetical protein
MSGINGRNRKIYIKTGSWAGCAGDWKSERKEGGVSIVTVSLSAGIGREPIMVDVKKGDFEIYYKESR